MKGLKPYICIHFIRTHWLQLLFFKLVPIVFYLGGCCRAHVTTPAEPSHPENTGQWQPFHTPISLLPLRLFPTEDLSDLQSFSIWWKFFLGVKKKYLLGKFIKWVIIMPFCKDTLWRPEERNSGRPSSTAKQNLPASGTTTGWGWGPRLRARGGEAGPFSKSNASGLEIKPSSHRLGAAFPISSFNPTLPICLLPLASTPFLRGQNEEQVAADWKTAIYLW